jgi:hypothetical protein
MLEFLITKSHCALLGTNHLAMILLKSELRQLPQFEELIPRPVG